MLYVDQPIGTGFSYGNDSIVSTTVDAAPYVWKFMQAFYAAFPQYENTDFGIFTESYGGHYGPQFASYFESQNAAVANGSIAALNINLVALGINNGWIDAASQYKAYPDFAYNNTYRRLISETQYTSYIDVYNSQCVLAMQNCTNLTGQQSACINADSTCRSVVETPIERSADFDVYDIRAPSLDPNPPPTYNKFLTNETVQNLLGAQSHYEECAYIPNYRFYMSGDG
jgi:carboxypeptidase C (cathepsin A)